MTTTTTTWIRTGCRALGPGTICSSWREDGIPCHACVGKRVPARLCYLIRPYADGSGDEKLETLASSITPQQAAALQKKKGGYIVYFFGDALYERQAFIALYGIGA